MHYRLFSVLIFALLPTLANATDSASERLSLSLRPYLDEDTVGIVVLELDSRWVTGVQEAIRNQWGEAGGGAGEPDLTEPLEFVERLRAAGARELCLVVGLHDLSPATGPIVLVTNETSEQAPELAALLRDVIRMPWDERGTTQVEPHHGHVIIGQGASVERYLQVEATPRPELLKPLLAAIDGQRPEDQARAGLVLAPGAEARRVIQALWPQLSPPFADLDGQLIADELVHVVAEVAAPPKWQASLTIRTRSDESATTTKQLIDNAWETAIEAASGDQAPPHAEDILRRASKVLAAERRQSSVALDAAHDAHEVGELLSRIVVPLVQQARASAYANTKMNHFKNIALAMHNFHASMKTFPASAAIVSEEGKPLLSWRVAVLPYLEKGGLFKQFHLDEPWDSPHNLRLVWQMPEVYADPQRSDLAAEGKTTYLVPTHPESVFPPLGDSPEIEQRSLQGRSAYWAKGMTVREITDGTSHTMMIVEVPSEQAVVWTKPADWEVDLARAWEQLQGGDGVTITAFCDAHAKAWDLERDKISELIVMVITRAGGEVIDSNKW